MSNSLSPLSCPSSSKSAHGPDASGILDRQLQIAIPGHRQAMGPEFILTIVVMDSRLASPTRLGMTKAGEFAFTSRFEF
jgi:hypothetical protein